MTSSEIKHMILEAGFDQKKIQTNEIGLAQIDVKPGQLIRITYDYGDGVHVKIEVFIMVINQTEDSYLDHFVLYDNVIPRTDHKNLDYEFISKLIKYYKLLIH